ncbi:hypothetical protein GIB67_032304 [Kingdonia uniflora]|uniref:DUF8040 domain-containing protein n=1 Tax=Kingdonia uniflora TaxID=39325 RepID=A0A7J7MXC8_9MAGN|nr:hypothetical protein GIB67_032304 [Kingdonia uniflora]
MNGNEDHRNNVIILATATTVVSIAIATTYLMLDNPREPYSNRVEHRNDHIKWILSSKKRCRWNLRMRREPFHHLCALIKDRDLLRDTRTYNVEEQLMRFLRIPAIMCVISFDASFMYMSKEYVPSGFGWDPSKKAVTAADKAWKILLEDLKNFDKLSLFLYEGPKWCFESLQVIFGQNHAIGKYSFNGLDSIYADNDIGGDDALEADSASMATSSANKRPRVHGKKAKTDDEVKNVLYSLHSSLEDMKNNIDPVKRASNIREEVMKVKGYSEHFLCNAWYIMMRDPVEL